ncbi:MAG: hypothetical protein ACI9S8_003242 [Chlamydiales bacterium]|jgi:hypothetical protein
MTYVSLALLPEELYAFPKQAMYNKVEALLSKGKHLKLEEGNLSEESFVATCWRKLSSQANSNAVSKSVILF